MPTFNSIYVALLLCAAVPCHAVVLECFPGGEAGRGATAIYSFAIDTVSGVYSTPELGEFSRRLKIYSDESTYRFTGPVQRSVNDGPFKFVLDDTTQQKFVIYRRTGEWSSLAAGQSRGPIDPKPVCKARSSAPVKF